MVQTLSKKQIEIIERRAIRRYKQKRRKKRQEVIMGTLSFIFIEAVLVLGVVHNFIVL